jgi:hypothetical protein
MASLGAIPGGRFIQRSTGKQKETAMFGKHKTQAVKDPAGDRDLANLIARGIKRQNKLSSAERPPLPAYFKDQMSEAR